MSSWKERFSVEGKKALVTGASKGIGQAICDVLASAGADIVAVGRDLPGLEETCERIRSHGREAVSVTGELNDAGDCERVAKEALEAFGSIDILVNNAAAALIEPLVDSSTANWDTTMNVNLRAPYIIAKTLAPNMIAQKRGKIINIASQTGVVALSDHAAYASSKAGLNMLTQVMTAEWAQHNIQSNSVCPTVVMTEMGKRVWSPKEMSEPMLAKIPLGRFGEPQEIADLVLFLASGASDLITGQVICADGGYTAL